MVSDRPGAIQTDDSSDCIEGRAITLQVDVWCSGGAGAGKGNAEDVVDGVARALKGWMDQDILTAHWVSAGIYMNS